MLNDKKIYFFTRIGGKSRFASKIIEYFPSQFSYYIEPFTGGGKIFLNLKKDINIQYIINDLDKDIYYLWKDVRKLSKEDLINLKWKGNKELFYYLKKFKTHLPLYRFYKNLYINFYSYSGDKESGYCSKNRICGQGFLKSFDDLQSQLENVKIFNADYKFILHKYNHENSFFYIDPPYLHKEHLYNHLSIDPIELEKELSNIKGKFLLSYNDHESIREIFKNYNIIEIEELYTSGPQKIIKKELLIKNY